MTASQTFDGFGFDLQQARFTGTVDLELDEAKKAALDEVLVFVIVAKVKDVAVKTVKEDIARIAVCKVSDARVLDDELRNSLVEGLGLVGEDTYVPISPKSKAVDEETGEIMDREEAAGEQGQFSFSDAEEAYDPSQDDGVTVVGRIGNGDAATPHSASGPRFMSYADFDTTGTVHNLDDASPVGRIGVTDPTLSSFLDDGLR
jgi:hypothetical protein